MKRFYKHIKYTYIENLGSAGLLGLDELMMQRLNELQRLPIPRQERLIGLIEFLGLVVQESGSIVDPPLYIAHFLL